MTPYGVIPAEAGLPAGRQGSMLPNKKKTFIAKAFVFLYFEINRRNRPRCVCVAFGQGILLSTT